jgi:hypothetical protein
MMSTITAYTTSLIGQAAVALLAAYALTTIHHLYGGVVDKASNRLLVPVILAPFIVIAMASLYLLQRSGNGITLIPFGIVALLWTLLLGLLHGGYAHLYKDILFLVGGPARLYYSLNPGEHYPPDNAFFEVTGALDLVAAAFVAGATVRLIQVWL